MRAASYSTMQKRSSARARKYFRRWESSWEKSQSKWRQLMDALKTLREPLTRPVKCFWFRPEARFELAAL